MIVIDGESTATETFYFIAHPCGDKDKVTVIDLSYSVDYKRSDWDTINDNNFTCHKEAIEYGRAIADKFNLKYELFNSRYNESLNETLHLILVIE